MRHFINGLLALTLLGGLAAPGSAEVFVLHTGGRVVGKLLNPDQSPRTSYEIEMASGGRITLGKDQVEQILRRKPEEILYERMRHGYADTTEQQWELAEWCREQGLLRRREKHLRRIIELDPDHEEARRALGYSRQANGDWATQEELMRQQGYRRYQGRWRTEQEIELLQKKREQEVAEKEWFQNLKRWRSWLNDDKRREALENIASIDDPAAVKALAAALEKESHPEVRRLLIEPLAQIGTAPAWQILAERAIDDPVEEVRLSCLDFLERAEHRPAVDYFVGKLRHKDNRMINRAAVALSYMDHPTAIGPLIESLVTTHKFKFTSGNGNQTSASFGTGAGGSPGGISVGSSTRIIKRQIANQAVLDALVSLTGGVNFNFDVQAWRYWYAAQKKSQKIKTRRD
jgi:hypothetical protein